MLRTGVLPAAWAAAATAGLVLVAGCASGAGSNSPAAAPHSSTAIATTTTTTTSAPVGTEQATFVPFTAAGRPSRPVVERATGYCWTQSLAARDAAAFRCMAANQILDPCFATSAHARTAACYADPWSKTVLLRLTRALPRIDGGSPAAVSPHSSPWALQLANGKHCVATTGTVDLVHGVAMDYLCGVRARAAIIGNPSRAGLLRADYSPDGRSLTTVAVSVSWQG